MTPSNWRLFPNARLEAEDSRFLALFESVLSRIPSNTPSVDTVVAVRIRRRGLMSGLAGLTRWKYRAQPGEDSGSGGASGRQTITFYTLILDRLSDSAYAAIIAHELAHAWLNEHVAPEESGRREQEADGLIRRWGFEGELTALEAETEPTLQPAHLGGRFRSDLLTHS